MKTKKQKNPDLYTREDGVLVAQGHVVVGNLKGYKQVGKKAKGKLVIEPEPFCKTC